MACNTAEYRSLPLDDNNTAHLVNAPNPIDDDDNGAHPVKATSLFDNNDDNNHQVNPPRSALVQETGVMTYTSLFCQVQPQLFHPQQTNRQHASHNLLLQCQSGNAPLHFATPLISRDHQSNTATTTLCCGQPLSLFLTPWSTMSRWQWMSIGK